VRLTVIIKYIINNEEKESILTWNYKVKCVSSNAWWDAASGI
jgi:hypothetical protein